MNMNIIRERMKELKIDLASLNKSYCELRKAKGDEKATPVNRRSMLAKAISDEGNPTLETFLDIISVLNGNLFIEWKDIKIQRLGGINNNH